MEKLSAYKRFKLFVSRILDKIAPSLLYGRYFYSQAGEDMLLSIYYEGKKHKGFYVDVGAHHPFRFSNTVGTASTLSRRPVFSRHFPGAGGATSISMSASATARS